MATSILVPKFNAASDTQLPIQYGKMIQIIIFSIDCGPPQVRRRISSSRESGGTVPQKL